MVDWGKPQREACWVQFKRWCNNKAAAGAFDPTETDTGVLNTYYDSTPILQVCTKPNYHRNYKKIATAFNTYSQTAGVRREGELSASFCRRRLLFFHLKKIFDRIFDFFIVQTC